MASPGPPSEPPDRPRPDLARRSLTAAVWNYAFSPVRLAVLFGRSVLLTRWIAVPVFGVYVLASTIALVTVIFAGFGLSAAFLHRCKETEDEKAAAAVHFTLRLVFATLWAAALLAFALLQPRDDLRLALVVVTLTGFVGQMVTTPKLILMRRVVHRRMAVVTAAGDVIASAVAVYLAWRGVGIWALLAVDLTLAAVNVLAYYVWRPIWRLRLRWDPAIVRYYLRFGRSNFPALSLATLIDRVDDLWLGFYVGDTALGFYSRAYRFATYPRTVLSGPVEQVASGTYAELAGDRERLSRAFFRTNAFLIRSGFLLAGALVVVAPEFVRLLLTAKWMPMVPTLRLLAVFAMLEPLKLTVSDMVTVSGAPERVLRARLLQLVILVTGLYTLGSAYGSAGVAVAVNVMLVAGLAYLFRQARRFADFSLRELFVVPTAAALLGAIGARLTLEVPGVLGADLRTATVKLAVFLTLFGAVLLAFERQRTAVIAGEALDRAGIRRKALRRQGGADK